MTRCLTNLGTGGRVFPRTPANGGVIDEEADGTSYAVFSDEGVLEVGTSTVAGFGHPLSDIARPLNLSVHRGLIEPGDDLVLVSGLGPGDIDGFIEGFAVDAAANVSMLFSMTLPGVHPFGLAYNPSSEFLYVLDTAGNQILTFRLAAPFMIAPTFVDIFADATAVPQLREALHIALLADGTGFDLLIANADLRLTDHTIDSFLENCFLFDPNNDGRIDGGECGLVLDDLKILPGYPDPVVEGQQSIEIFASAGADIEVHTVDPSDNSSLGLLGVATVPSNERLVVVPLSRSLVAGEFVLAFDTTNTIGIPGVPIEVQAAIPAVSEWGLIVLTLLLLTAATIGIRRWQPALAMAGGGTVSVSSRSRSPLLHPALLGKVLAATFGVVVVGFAVAIRGYGPLATRDIVGSLISAVILAYLVHLWLLPRGGEGTNQE